MITDVAHFWGNDLSTGNTGDLATVTGIQLGQQRILRRLLTNPGDYLFHPDYGAGLPGYVGQPMDVAAVTGVIRSQMLMEESVAKTPAPEIAVKQLSSDLTGLSVSITYTDAPSNTPAVLSFNVTA